MKNNKRFVWMIAGVVLLFIAVATVSFIVNEVKQKDSDMSEKSASATANGYGGELTVEVIVKGDEIILVKVMDNKETVGIGTPAIEKIPAEIVAKQSLAIDTITGATFTSKAILEASTEALKSLGCDIDKLMVKVEDTSAPKQTVKKTADAVIIGSGGAGMNAAVELIKAGKTVIILEKTPTIGGITKLAGSAYNTSNFEYQSKLTMGQTELEEVEQWANMESKDDYMKKWQDTLKKEIAEYKAAGSTYLFDSPSLHKIQTYHGGDYVGNPALIEILADNSQSGFEYLQELGVNWQPKVVVAIGAMWSRSHASDKTWGVSGTSFVLPQEKFVKENNGEILVDHKAEELIVEDGVVVGVKGKTTDGTPFEMRANLGVLVATGGFSTNVEMRQKYNNGHWADLGPDVPTTNAPITTGDGIIMAEKVGANLVGMEWIQLVPYSAFNPEIDNLIFVNKQGNRFVKEDGRRDEMSNAILKQGVNNAWRIMDAHTVEDVFKGVSTDGRAIDDMVDNKTFFKADTLEELATQVGIETTQLLKTIEAFNKTVETKEGDPFGRTTFGFKLDKGPYYASIVEAKIHHTMGGIEINTNAEVLDKNGNVIPGLYAAGETVGGIHGANRLGGNAITDIIVFGRLAGQNIAAATR